MSSCPVCYTDYDNGQIMPMVLDCGHTICVDCLKSISSSRDTSTKKCPMCQHKFKNFEQYKKNYALMDQIEENKKIKEEEIACRCADKPCFYCRKCKKFLCTKCVQNHYGHPIDLYDPSTALVREKVESMILGISRMSNCTQLNIEKMDRAKEEVKLVHKKNLQKLKEITKAITKTVHEEEERIANDLEERLMLSLKEIDKIKNSVTFCFESFMKIKEELLLVYKPVEQIEIIISKVDKTQLEKVCLEAEESIKKVYESCPPDFFKLPVYSLKSEGRFAIHNRTKISYIDCIKIIKKDQSINLPKPASEIRKASENKRKQTM